MAEDEAPRRVTRAASAKAETIRPKRKIRTSNENQAEVTTGRPARKRSKITEEPEGESATPAPAVQLNGNAPAAAAPATRETRRVSRQERVSLPIGRRAPSGTMRRNVTETGGTLSRTEYYTIKQLPGLPDALRHTSDPFRAFFQSLSANTHDVVVTTKSTIYIWEYTTTISSPVPNTIRLPEPLKSSSDKLPLAASTLNGASNASKDTGLVVVYPNSGRVWYWPKVESKNAWSMHSSMLERYEGSVKLMSGEIVEKMVKVEHGGYVLVLSSGRLAYLSLQDRNSRSEVGVSIFSTETQASRGFFGVAKSILGTAWRNTIAGVKTRTKNNRFETIALTQEGMLKAWDVEYDGSATFKGKLDLMDELREAYEANGVIKRDSKVPITFIDFALRKRSSSTLVRGKGDELNLHMVALVAIHQPKPANESDTGREGEMVYNLHLAHISIAGSSIDWERFTPIHVFAPPTLDPDQIDINIPDPGHLAFVTTPNAVMIVSLEKIYHDAHAALRNPIWQDIVYFQYKLGAEVISAAPEFHAISHSGKAEQAGLLIFTKNAGAVRIIADRPPRDPAYQSIGPKPKIEQDVFFGKYAEPVLNFGKSGAFNFDTREVESAAKTLSHEILTSSHPNIADGTIGTATQIYWRQQQMRRLIDFVMSKYDHPELGQPISRATKWQLLWDAEKLEAAAKLWKVYESWLEARQSDDKILFPLFVASIPDKDRTTQPGDVDPVRLWFAKDVPKIGKIMNYLETVILSEHKLQKGKWELLVQYISEAQDVINALLGTAYEFRAANLEWYGLKDEPIQHGILKTVKDYEGLPEPWTATRNVSSHLESYVSATTRLLVDLSEETQDEATKIDRRLLHRLRTHQWRLVFITCLTHTERGRWAQSRTDEAEQKSGFATLMKFEKELRGDMLLGLAELGRAEDGMRICEKFGDMHGLVALCLAEIEYLSDEEEHLRLHPDERLNAAEKRKDLYKRLNAYFSSYGKPFAHAFFTAQVDNGRLADLLTQDFGKNAELTAYLRADAELPPEQQRWNKFVWINEVLREKNLKRAGEQLFRMAVEKEPNAWARDRQLGLAKLYFLASTKALPQSARKRNAHETPKAHKDMNTGEDETLNDAAGGVFKAIERQKVFEEMRQKLRAHLKPTVQLATTPNDAPELCMKEFGNHGVKDREANAQILRQAFANINRNAAINPADLIDAFSLMDNEACDEERASLQNKLFLCAVKTLWSTGWFESGQSEVRSRAEEMRNLIWKRLFIRDDWVRIHHVKGKRDRDVQKACKSTLLYETLRAGGLEGLWDAHPAYTLPKPTTCIGAFSDASSLSPWRFEDPTLAAGVAADNKLDDELLTDYVSRCRVDFQFDTCRALAGDAVEEVNKEREERRKARAEKVREMIKGAEGRGRRGLVGELGEDLYAQDEGEEGPEEEGMDVDEEVLTEEHLRGMQDA